MVVFGLRSRLSVIESPRLRWCAAIRISATFGSLPSSWKSRIRLPIVIPLRWYTIRWVLEHRACV